MHLLRTSVSTLIGKHKIHLEEHGAIKNKFQMGDKCYAGNLLEDG